MHLKKKSGLSLLELVITTMVVAIIVVGIASMEVALRQSEKSTSRNALLAMRTSGLMFHIRKNIELATGDATSPGVVCTTVDLNGDCLPADTLYIRQENQALPVATRTVNYNDDIWFRYRHLADHSLLFCRTDRVGDLNPVGSDCAPGVIEENLGALFSMDIHPQMDRVAQDFFIQVTLRNRIDMARPADPFDNPQLNLTTNISPLSSSF